jgi:hypothetical protein
MILITEAAGDSLTGLINGSNRVFVTSFNFVSAQVNVYMNGRLKVRDWDDGFTVTEPRTVTMKEAPEVGDSLHIEYQSTVRGGGGALGGVPSIVTNILAPQIIGVDDDDCD